MSISAVSNASSVFVSPQSTTRRQQEDAAGRQLEQALQSGDLATATQAYDKLAAFGPNNSGPFVDPSLASQFAALGQDLQAGNLGAAQQGMAQLGTNLLQHDAQIVQQDYKNGNLQAAQQAITNLEGDYWAVTGQRPAASITQGAPSPATNGASTSPAVNLTA